MIIQPLKSTDAQTAVSLWNGALPDDALTRELLHEKIWGDPDFDPGLVWMAWADRTPLGLVVGVVRDRPATEDRPAGPMGFVKMLAVAPSFRRRRIGSELYDRLEAGLRDRGVREIRVGESAPNYLQPGIDVRELGGLRFFAQAGFESIGETVNLRVDLGRLPDRPEDPDGFAIDRVGPDTESAVRELVLQNWPSWSAEVNRALQNDPRTVFAAFSGDRAVAFSAWDANNVGTGWFGPMGTEDAHTGKGIGAALLWACMDGIRAQGHSEATIPWVGPVGFYGKHVGAQTHRIFRRMEKVL